jgi:hypothetical protein
MTALYKSADTIYQCIVKLNVRGLTELRTGMWCAAEGALSLGQIRQIRARSSDQRIQFRTVQASCTGTQGLERECQGCGDRSVEVLPPNEGAWPSGSECVNVRAGNPAVIGTYVP